MFALSSIQICKTFLSINSLYFLFIVVVVVVLFCFCFFGWSASSYVCDTLFQAMHPSFKFLKLRSNSIIIKSISLKCYRLKSEKVMKTRETILVKCFCNLTVKKLSNRSWLSEPGTRSWSPGPELSGTVFSLELEPEL